ncbi:MAG: YggT family protein [Clostridia bacterium]|nr:YggT family protein [Clostridia bacterium]
MQAIAYVISTLIYAMNILIVIRCVLSFFPQTLYSQGGKVIVAITEPLLAPCRKLLMRFDFARSLPVDLSPILAFLILSVISRLIGVLFYL